MRRRYKEHAVIIAARQVTVAAAKASEGIKDLAGSLGVMMGEFYNLTHDGDGMSEQAARIDDLLGALERAYNALAEEASDMARKHLEGSGT